MNQHPNAIRRFRKAASLSLEELADLAGLSASQVSRIERGEREATLTDLRNFAKVLKVPVAALVADAPVLVVGYVGAGAAAVFFQDGQGALEEVERPPEASDHTVAVVVRGESMAGTAEDGWLLYYDDVRTPPSEDLFGRLCVVGLIDGRVIVKRLQPGRSRGRYDLYSSTAKPLLDQEVEWAALVTWIKPR